MLVLCGTVEIGRKHACTQLSQNIPTNDRGNPNFYAQSITILKPCMMSLAPENSLWLSCVGICGGQTGRVWTNVQDPCDAGSGGCDMAVVSEKVRYVAL